MTALRSVRRLLRYSSPQRARLAIGAIVAVVSALGGAAYAYLVGPTLQGLLTGQTGERGFLPPHLLPVALVGVAVLKGLAGLAYATLMVSAGQRTLEAIREDVFGHLLQLPPRFFADRHSGELFARLTSDLAQVEFSVAQAFGSYVKDGLQLLALLGVCAWLDLRLFLLAFVALPAAIVPVSQFARRVRRTARGSQASLARLAAHASEQIQGLEVVQAFRAEPAALAHHDALAAQHLVQMRRSLLVRGAFTPVLELLGIGGLALALSFGTRWIALEPTLAPKLLSFLSAALLMYPPLRSFSGTLAATLVGTSAAERLFEIRDTPLAPPRPRRARALSGKLVFEDVAVSYAGGRLGLAGASFEVRAGQLVALVGPSGGGKSTALAAVLGLVEPCRGRLLWDGLPHTELDTTSVRAQVGWVPQEPTLLSGSLAENLRLSRPDAEDNELWESLRLAHAAAFVEALPQQLDEPVGERGAQLSGGQRQRIAIARAYLRRPSLLLLDEPTRALDALSEREVQAGLDALLQGRTALVVAHRLSTVERADWIVVLEDGRVVEQGTHEGLRVAGGRYAHLLGTSSLSSDLAPEQARG